MIPRLLERYRQEVAPKLREEMGDGNPLAIPRIEKVTVSMGIGAAIEDKKRIDLAVRDLAILSGQKPVVCLARKSVSNFKLRQGYPIGCKVTLRGRRMYEFLDRLIATVIPRIRDFRGLNPNAFDGRGNYSLGLAEQSVFPEVEADKIEFGQGMNVTIVTSAQTDAQGRQLLAYMGMPFRN